MLGEYLFTPAAGPAVVLYTAINAVQAVGWHLIARVFVKQGLCGSPQQEA